MLKLVSDENFNGDILRGLFRRCPDLDVMRVQDVGLGTTPDPDILEWAALNDRVLITHDFDTMPFYAYGCVKAGRAMLGVFLVSDQMPIGQAIDEILLAVDCLTAGWHGQGSKGRCATGVLASERFGSSLCREGSVLFVR